MFPGTELTTALQPEHLEALAGRDLFARATELFRGERAHGIRIEEDRIGGTVRDGVWRECWIGIEHAALSWGCNCGGATKMRPCEHAVTLGLEGADLKPRFDLRQRRISFLLPLSDDRMGPLPSLSIRAMKHLLTAKMDALPKSSEHVGRALSKDLGGRERARELLDLVLDCFRTRGHLDFHGYQQMHSRGRTVVDAIERDAKQIPAPDLAQVLEASLAAIESVLDSVNDSSGGFGYLLGRCSQLHERACRRGGLDAVALGVRLASWSVESGFDAFTEPEDTHGAALGAAGIQAFRHECERLRAE